MSRTSHPTGRTPILPPPGSGQAEPIQASPGQAEPIQASPGQAGPGRTPLIPPPGSGQAEPSQASPGQAGPGQDEDGNTGDGQAGDGQAGGGQSDDGQAGDGQVDQTEGNVEAPGPTPAMAYDDEPEAEHECRQLESIHYKVEGDIKDVEYHVFATMGPQVFGDDCRHLVHVVIPIGPAHIFLQGTIDFRYQSYHVDVDVYVQIPICPPVRLGTFSGILEEGNNITVSTKAVKRVISKCTLTLWTSSFNGRKWIHLKGEPPINIFDMSYWFNFAILLVPL
ncbi:hypothetical protein BDW22DRAFT_1430727 [Trametopsis cervina]|nr:hypothetical protein BDW22DRAFT_1430727 [Trametopsis cervina]